jgi:hypothetical protein
MRHAFTVAIFICFPLLAVNCFKVMMILLSVFLLLFFFTFFHRNINFSALAMLLSTLSCDCLYIFYSCSHCCALNGLKSTYISVDLSFFFFFTSIPMKTQNHLMMSIQRIFAALLHLSFTSSLMLLGIKT